MPRRGRTRRSQALLTILSNSPSPHRIAFLNELTQAVTEVISKYHADRGRPHRLIVAVHPSITEDADPPAEEQLS